MELCLKCGNESYIKEPGKRVMLDSLWCMVHIANEFKYKCLNPKCKYASDVIKEDTEIGKWRKLPLWKKMFTAVRG